MLGAPGEPGARPPVPLARCAGCGSAVTLAPAPADAHETGAYAPGAPRLARVVAPVLAAFDRRRLALVRALVAPPARLVDAGAGRGRFVVAAPAARHHAPRPQPAAPRVAPPAPPGLR